MTFRKTKIQDVELRNFKIEKSKKKKYLMCEK